MGIDDLINVIKTVNTTICYFHQRLQEVVDRRTHLFLWFILTIEPLAPTMREHEITKK